MRERLCFLRAPQAHPTPSPSRRPEASGAFVGPHPECHDGILGTASLQLSSPSFLPFVLPPPPTEVVVDSHVNKNTIVDWFNFCRDICSKALQSQDHIQKIGGIGKIAEIGKRKYHWGARREEQWVFRDMERETAMSSSEGKGYTNFVAYEIIKVARTSHSCKFSVAARLQTSDETYGRLCTCFPTSNTTNSSFG